MNMNASLTPAQVLLGSSMAGVHTVEAGIARVYPIKRPSGSPEPQPESYLVEAGSGGVYIGDRENGYYPLQSRPATNLTGKGSQILFGDGLSRELRLWRDEAGNPQQISNGESPFIIGVYIIDAPNNFPKHYL